MGLILKLNYTTPAFLVFPFLSIGVLAKDTEAFRVFIRRHQINSLPSIPPVGGFLPAREPLTKIFSGEPFNWRASKTAAHMQPSPLEIA